MTVSGALGVTAIGNDHPAWRGTVHDQRRWGIPQGRPTIVALEGSFHGRTTTALAATGQPVKRAAFEPLVDWFRFVAPDDEVALDAAITPDEAVAAFGRAIATVSGAVA